MRAALIDKAGPRPPDHVGLAYDRWAPLDASTGKMPDDRRREWLRALAGTRVSDDYQHAFRRWTESLRTADTRMAEVELSSRLLVGHGNPSPTEVGLTVHHTWGVPVIPGSALKGLLNHYVDAVYGPAATGVHPMAPDFPETERDRAPFRGVTWIGNRIEHGPGEVHRALFGAPRARTDGLYADAGAGETVGLVVFHDALFVPGSAGDTPFAVDVLTVHQKPYYDHQGRRGGPNDYEDPNPVAFLTVRPGTKLLVALTGPAAWTGLAFGLLRDALVEWGAGGKTTSGYGHIRPEGWTPIWPPGDAVTPAPKRGAGAAAPAALSPLVEELRAWLFGEEPTQREKLALLRTRWLPRLATSTPEDRQEIAKIVRKGIKNIRLAVERDELIREIVGEPAARPGEPG